MARITLPDGSNLDVDDGTTAAQFAEQIGPGLAKAALAARINGQLVDLSTPLHGDVSLQIITAKDTPGFIVNLLLIPYLLDGVRAYESGVASREDIDAGMKLGCNMPMGPLELLDFVGVDTTLFIADVMYDEFRDPKYAAPPLLRKMVLAGFHGRKSGKGFYDYGK